LTDLLPGKISAILALEVRISFYTSMLYLCIRMNAVNNPSRASKPSFQVNGFGGTKLVRAKEMYQFGIIPVDQGVYFLNAECF